MVYKKASCALSVFCFPFIITHPFYKTMSEEAEQEYLELKNREKETINAFKVAYPDIPAHLWDNLFSIEEVKKTWFSDTAATKLIMEKPHMKENPSKDDLKKYCADFIEYACVKEGLDFEKIGFSETTDKIVNLFGYTHYKPNITYITDEGELLYTINLHGSSPVLLSSDTIINNLSPEFIETELKTSLFSMTECCTEKKILIEKFINQFYNQETIKSKSFNALIESYKAAHRDIRKFLSTSLFSENITNPPELSTKKTDLAKDNNNNESNSKNIKKWLKKIIYLCTLPYDPFS